VAYSYTIETGGVLLHHRKLWRTCIVNKEGAPAWTWSCPPCEYKNTKRELDKRSREQIKTWAGLLVRVWNVFLDSGSRLCVECLTRAVCVCVCAVCLLGVLKHRRRARQKHGELCACWEYKNSKGGQDKSMVCCVPIGSTKTQKEGKTKAWCVVCRLGVLELKSRARATSVSAGRTQLQQLQQLQQLTVTQLQQLQQRGLCVLCDYCII